MAFALFTPVALLAQATPDSTKPEAKQSQSSAPAIDFSGVLFANYQYRGDAGARAFNKFDIERAYLTFRMPAGEHLSIRVTADVFQQTSSASDSFYKGWVIRAKYAYLEYKLHEGPGWSALVRGGLLQNVVIDQVESFWQRWIALSPIERAGFFSSSDAGVGILVSFPGKLGEANATVVNGPGYTSRETDRFKDYAMRVTLTPFARVNQSVLRTLGVTGWIYDGSVGSAFADGGPGQVATVGVGLPRSRAGVFVGVKDPRLAAGVEIDTRRDGTETGANTLASPRVEFDSSGRLLAAFAIVKPFKLKSPASTIPLGLVARWDQFKPNTATSGYINSVITGLTWDLNKQSAISLDYQEQVPHAGASSPSPKTYFVHVVASF